MLPVGALPSYSQLRGIPGFGRFGRFGVAGAAARTRLQKKSLRS